MRIKHCKNCGKEMTEGNYIGYWVFLKRYFCSRSCAKLFKYKEHTVTYKCEECGKEKTIRLAFYNKSKHHFCSVKCHGIYNSKNKSGINHWNWQGGISGEQKLIRQTPEYNQWRLLVYKRDFYTCQECGHKHIDIIAHHIKSFAEFEDLRFKVDNGVTLCRSCHKKVHKEIGLTTQFV